jgi:hypothetical protein
LSSEISSGDESRFPPVGSKIRQIAFDDRCAPEIASALGGASSLASFRLPSGAVYQVMVPGQDEKPAAMLTIWPTIKRIDVIGPALTVVFTDVATIDLVGEIEVQFRRSNRDLLIVARGGKIIVRA